MAGGAGDAALRDGATADLVAGAADAPLICSCLRHASFLDGALSPERL